MKIVGMKILSEFSTRHADVRSQIGVWLQEVEDAQWQMPPDIKARYPHASILDNKRVIFNLKGNKYRLEVKVSYKNQTVLVKRIGTHAEYSKWD